MLKQILAEHRVTELSLTVTGDRDKVICLHTTGLFEDLNDGLLDLLVRVVDVNEDLFDCVRVQAR